AKRRRLLLVGPLVDVGGKLPLARSHRTWRVGNHRDVKPVERHLVIGAFIDVEDERDVADTLSWPRRQRCRRRDKARTDHIAVAVLEIVTGQLPFCGHGFPQRVSSTMTARRMYGGLTAR